jgi:mRNA-degrading endonuclease toxin of MazEF toxin-antitoxin module
MHKDFDQWNKKKKSVNDRSVVLHYHPREVWWCYVGVNVGTEQDGDAERFLRPVVIIRGFGPNACLIVPLTTSKKEHAMRIDVGLVDSKQARANISQIKVVDTRRLLEKVCIMGKPAFEAIRKAIRDMI